MTLSMTLFKLISMDASLSFFCANDIPRFCPSFQAFMMCVCVSTPFVHPLVYYIAGNKRIPRRVSTSGVFDSPFWGCFFQTCIS